MFWKSEVLGKRGEGMFWRVMGQGGVTRRKGVTEELPDKGVLLFCDVTVTAGIATGEEGNV